MHMTSVCTLARSFFAKENCCAEIALIVQLCDVTRSRVGKCRLRITWHHLLGDVMGADQHIRARCADMRCVIVVCD